MLKITDISLEKFGRAIKEFFKKFFIYVISPLPILIVAAFIILRKLAKHELQWEKGLGFKKNIERFLFSIMPNYLQNRFQIETLEKKLQKGEKINLNESLGYFFLSLGYEQVWLDIIDKSKQVKWDELDKEIMIFLKELLNDDISDDRVQIRVLVGADETIPEFLVINKPVCEHLSKSFSIEITGVSFFDCEYQIKYNNPEHDLYGDWLPLSKFKQFYINEIYLPIIF